MYLCILFIQQVALQDTMRHLVPITDTAMAPLHYVHGDVTLHHLEALLLQTWSDLFRHVQTCSNMSRHVQTCSAIMSTWRRRQSLFTLLFTHFSDDVKCCNFLAKWSQLPPTFLMNIIYHLPSTNRNVYVGSSDNGDWVANCCWDSSIFIDNH